METSSKLQIHSGVRAVLARYLVDPRGVEISATRDLVRLRGQIYHLGQGPNHPMSPETLLNIEQEILRIKGVQRVFFELHNWSRTGGRWVQSGLASKARRAEREKPDKADS